MDLHVGHLPAWLYRAVQSYLHGGYASHRRILGREREALRARGGGPRVLELACGLGSLAELFPPEAYLGVDSSGGRVAAARAAHPGWRFETLDVTSPGFDRLLEGSSFVFCHGLLHHLGDRECRELIGRVRRSCPRPAAFVALEPLLPEPAWRNPPGWLLMKMDEGRFVRGSAGYRALFGDLPLSTERYTLLPRFPLEMEAYAARMD